MYKKLSKGVKMKKFNLFSLLIIFIFVGCSKPMNNYSTYIFNPQTEHTQQLKNKYSNSLYNAYKNMHERGIPIQKAGLGFTSGEGCEPLCDNKPGDFWVYIISPYEKPISTKKYNTINKRAEKVFKHKVQDIIYAVKYAPSEKLVKDKSLKGVLIGTNWPVYSSIGEYFEPKEYEEADIYIPYSVIEKYVKYEIYFSDLLCNSFIFTKNKESKRKNIKLCKNN